MRCERAEAQALGEGFSQDLVRRLDVSHHCMKADTTVPKKNENDDVHFTGSDSLTLHKLMSTAIQAAVAAAVVAAAAEEDGGKEKKEMKDTLKLDEAGRDGAHR